ASSLESLFVRNAIDPTVDEKELIANLEQLALSTAITFTGARGKMPDPSLESKRFLDALASLKSEYESILYRILLYDGPNGTECLRGWVVFDDLPAGDLNVSRIDLGPCTYVEWREPLDPGIATLANR